MDGPTNRARCRVACTRLKSIEKNPYMEYIKTRLDTYPIPVTNRWATAVMLAYFFTVFVEKLIFFQLLDHCSSKTSWLTSLKFWNMNMCLILSYFNQNGGIWKSKFYASSKMAKMQILLILLRQSNFKH